MAKVYEPIADIQDAVFSVLLDGVEGGLLTVVVVEIRLQRGQNPGCPMLVHLVQPCTEVLEQRCDHALLAGLLSSR